MGEERENLLQTECDPTFVIIGRKLETDIVARHDLDAVETHFAAQMSQDFSAVFELDPELGVRESFEDDSVCLGQWGLSHNFNCASVILTYSRLILQEGIRLGLRLAFRRV